MKTKYFFTVSAILVLVACGDPGLPEREDSKLRPDSNRIPAGDKESNGKTK